MADQEHTFTEGNLGSLRSYIVGFALLLVLSAVTFALAMTGALPAGASIPIILVLAAVQIGTLIVAYLGFNRSSDEGGWTLLTSIYAIIVLAILVGATVWIMYHLNHNMMENLQ